MKQIENGSKSTKAALAVLVGNVAALLEEGVLDPRFAEKLSRKIRHEAESGDVNVASLESLDSARLTLTLDGLDAAITQGKVNGLMAVLAQMRDADAVAVERADTAAALT